MFLTFAKLMAQSFGMVSVEKPCRHYNEINSVKEDVNFNYKGWEHVENGHRYSWSDEKHGFVYLGEEEDGV